MGIYGVVVVGGVDVVVCLVVSIVVVGGVVAVQMTLLDQSHTLRKLLYVVLIGQYIRTGKFPTHLINALH